MSRIAGISYSGTDENLTDFLQMRKKGAMRASPPAKKGKNSSVNTRIAPPALAAYFFNGMVKINRVEDASLSAFSVPLCSSAMVRAMDSPRPKPDFSPREASAR